MKMNEMKQLLQSCKELGIETLGELARFKAEEEQGNLLKVMARYLELNEIYRRLNKRGI